MGLSPRSLGHLRANMTDRVYAGTQDLRGRHHTRRPTDRLHRNRNTIARWPPLRSSPRRCASCNGRGHSTSCSPRAMRSCTRLGSRVTHLLPAAPERADARLTTGSTTTATKHLRTLAICWRQRKASSSTIHSFPTCATPPTPHTGRHVAHLDAEIGLHCANPAQCPV